MIQPVLPTIYTGILALQKGIADVLTINPGDESASKNSLYDLDREPIDYYTL